MRQQSFKRLTGLPESPDRFDHAGGCDFQPATVVHAPVGDRPRGGLWHRLEVARWLGVSPRFLYGLKVARRLLDHPERPGWYVPEEVEAWRLHRHGPTVARRRA